MGNIVSNWKVEPPKSLTSSVWMSSGSTDILISALALSASDRAVTAWQKAFASWIGSFDCSMFGLGMACWDVDDIAWTREGFDAQKAFVLETFDKACEHYRWDVFPFQVGNKIDDTLQRVRQLVVRYTIDVVETDHQGQRYQYVQTIERCPTHGIYVYRVLDQTTGIAEHHCAIDNLFFKEGC